MGSEPPNSSPPQDLSKGSPLPSWRQGPCRPSLRHTFPLFNRLHAHALYPAHLGTSQTRVSRWLMPACSACECTPSWAQGHPSAHPAAAPELGTFSQMSREGPGRPGWSCEPGVRAATVQRAGRRQKSAGRPSRGGGPTGPAAASAARGSGGSCSGPRHAACSSHSHR